ncbi:hypothetical protein K2173_005943 [Erythroxylum novogranatense]|uniref:Uncharacterized protein n=1 Tax=Erythroxylum novogranatense TaxID=1862640 RepID=A0AAV8TS12_9ROSI|nr:hypothetical protein K2173_005943 [Erythroxylum novogranatense]
MLNLPRKMPRKRLLIFRKVSNLFRASAFIVKMKKPAIPTLFFLKKSRRFKHYSYRFLQKEYEFSPSSTPLIQYQKKLSRSRSYRDNIFSLLFLCRCLGGLKAEVRREVDYRQSMGSSYAAIDGDCSQLGMATGRVCHPPPPPHEPTPTPIPAPIPVEDFVGTLIPVFVGV